MNIVDEINQRRAFKAIYLGVLTDSGAVRYKFLSDDRHPDIQLIAARLTLALDIAIKSDVDFGVNEL